MNLKQLEYLDSMRLREVFIVISHIYCQCEGTEQNEKQKNKMYWTWLRCIEPNTVEKKKIYKTSYDRANSFQQQFMLTALMLPANCETNSNEILNELIAEAFLAFNANNQEKKKRKRKERSKLSTAQRGGMDEDL